MGYSPWGRKESDTTEHTHTHTRTHIQRMIFCKELAPVIMGADKSEFLGPNVG